MKLKQKLLLESLPKAKREKILRRALKKVKSASSKPNTSNSETKSSKKPLDPKKALALLKLKELTEKANGTDPATES